MQKSLRSLIEKSDSSRPQYYGKYKHYYELLVIVGIRRIGPGGKGTDGVERYD